MLLVELVLSLCPYSSILLNLIGEIEQNKNNVSFCFSPDLWDYDPDDDADSDDSNLNKVRHNQWFYESCSHHDTLVQLISQGYWNSKPPVQQPRGHWVGAKVSQEVTSLAALAK